jgi:hypothetical protein
MQLTVNRPRDFNSTCCPPKILLIGDSLDRHVVEEVCFADNLTLRDWSNGTFGYRKDTWGAALCETSKGIGSISFLHVFGSNASGPYLRNLISTPTDPFVDTKARVCKGIEMYSNNVKVPTLIVFHIVLWDVHILRKQKYPPEQVKVQRFRNNMIARVQEIQSCKNRSSILMLRTAPAMRWGQSLVVLFNDVLKNISKEMGIGIIDYDDLLWGMDRSESREPKLFRDQTHPRKEFSAKFARHLLSIGGDICKRSACAEDIST